MAAAIVHDPSGASVAREEERTAAKGVWADRVEEMLNTGGNLAAALPIGPNRLLALCGMAGPGDDKAVFRRMIERIRRQPGVRMWCCLSSSFRDLDDAGERCREVVKGLSAFPVMGDVVYESAEIPEPEWMSLSEETAQFRSLIERGEERETLRRMVDQLFDRFRDRRYGLDDVAAALQQLEDRLFDGLPFRETLHFAAGPDVSRYGSYDDLKALFLQDLEPFVARDGKNVCVEQQMLVDKALRYMKDHYNKDLRATKVASWINVSPNYFSQLIKKVTGKHFNDLLHEIRIDRAKRLLEETDYRIFQIGRLVGYKEYKYFVHSFKRLTSVSPSRYRMLAYESKRKNLADDERNPAEPANT